MTHHKRLNGTPVGAPGPSALCDFCNAPLSNGDDVKLVGSTSDGQLWLSRVVCDDHDLETEDAPEYAVHASAELSTAAFKPDQLVVARAEPLATADE